MKGSVPMKLILSIAVLLMLLIPASGQASIPDISSLSRDELMELNSIICSKLELVEDFEPFEVPMGFWTVGDNIPEGIYCISSKDGSMVAVDITENADMSYHEFVKTDVDLIYVVLIKGAQVQIRSGSVVFSPAGSVKFASE
jgi:hypothetical protein